MDLVDQLRFWLEMLWRLPVAVVALVYDWLGLPLVLGIFVVIFCCLAYRYLVKLMEMKK